jgi:hypothetical protein
MNRESAKKVKAWGKGKEKREKNERQQKIMKVEEKEEISKGKNFYFNNFSMW